MEYAFLEHCLRADLDDTAERVMAVIRPIKLTITNYPEGQSETFEVENHPKHPEMGTRHRHLLPGALYRGGGLPGDPDPQVQTPVSRRP